MARQKRLLLALVREDMDIHELPADPRWFMAPPVSPVLTALIILAGVAGTVGIGMLYAARIGLQNPPEVRPAITAVVIIVVGLCWAALLWGISGRRERAHFFHAHARMVSAGLVPEQGIVTRSEITQSDSGVIQKCWVDVMLDSGEKIRAIRHPRRSESQAVSRSSHHAPQHGDLATVFVDPAGEVAPLVLTNRHARTA